MFGDSACACVKDVQVVVGALTVCRSQRISEEVIADAVQKHFLRQHKNLPPGVGQEVFEKWAAKMACGIKEMCVRFKRSYTVTPDGAKSKKIGEMKKDLTRRLSAAAAACDSQAPVDDLEVLEHTEDVAAWKLLDDLLQARATVQAAPLPRPTEPSPAKPQSAPVLPSAVARLRVA